MKTIATSDGRISFRSDNYLQHHVWKAVPGSFAKDFNELILYTTITPEGKIIRYDTYKGAVEASGEIMSQLREEYTDSAK